MTRGGSPWRDLALIDRHRPQPVVLADVAAVAHAVCRWHLVQARATMGPESMVSDSLGMKSDGAYVSDTPAALKEFGVDGYQYKENMTINDLQQAPRTGRPSCRSSPRAKAHALVVDSVQDGKVNIRDPWPSGSGSAYSLPVDDFQQSWNGGKGAVIP